MARDYAKQRTAGNRKPSTRKKQPSGGGSKRAAPANKGPGNGVRWYGAGVLTGVFLSFLLYLGTLPPAGSPKGAEDTGQATQEAAETPPKPRFDFYTMLPEQSIEEVEAPAETARPQASSKPNEYYMLQAGSFRQRDDADRRRAELLLLGLEPRVEENNGDNGRWFRVYLGPFDSRSKMAKARSLTAAQNIDTLVLKRSG